MTQEELQFKINLIAVLEDIQDSLLNELPDNFRHGAKMWLNKTKFATGRFIKECDKILSEKSQEGLGISSDMLKEYIEEKVKRGS